MGCTGSKSDGSAAVNNVLAKGAKLEKAQSITSANGKYRLIVQEDGNVVLYESETAVWSTETAGKTVTHVALTEEGDVALFNGEEKVWNAGATGADAVVLQDDRNVVAYAGEHKAENAKWSTNTVAPAAAAAPVDDGAYDLRTRQAVVARRTPIAVNVTQGETYYWCTCGRSKNQPFCDGSHAGSEFKPMAWTAPETKEVYFCACKQTKNAPFCDGTHAALPFSNELKKDSLLHKDGELRSTNNDVFLKLQLDGNLVLYRGADALWASGTDGKAVTHLAFAEDGDLVLYSQADRVWSAGCTGADALVVQDDHNLVAYGAGEAKWASNTAKAAEAPAAAEATA